MWKSIVVIKLENYWKFTPEIEGRFFRLRHIDPPKSPVGWIGQAEAIPNTNFHQFFRPQRLNGLSVYETDEYLKPPIFATRKLGFRQQSSSPNNWLIEVEVNLLMPSYPLEDAPVINPSAASNKVTNKVTVLPTVTKLASANPNRTAIKFYIADKFKSVFIDTDNIVAGNSAIESVTPSKPVCVPYVIWTGDWYGICSSGNVEIEVEEYFR